MGIGNISSGLTNPRFFARNELYFGVLYFDYARCLFRQDQIVTSIREEVMDLMTIAVRSLWVEYQTYRRELLVFTILFVLAAVLVPITWIINHAMHQYWWGCCLGLIAFGLGISMALQCGEKIKILRGVAKDINDICPGHMLFRHDLGKATDSTRHGFEIFIKFLAGALMLWCFTPWPQI